MNRLRMLVIGLGATLTACVIDRLEVVPPPCGGDTDCAILNLHEGISDTACGRFQCDAASRACVFRDARDDDDDGEPARACGGVDCDDEHADAHPGAAEACDGRDQDCDGAIDEGPYATEIVARNVAADARYRIDGDASSPFTTFVSAPGLASLDVGPIAGERTPLSIVRGALGEGGLVQTAALEEGCVRFVDVAPFPRPEPEPVGVGMCASHDDCDDGVLCNGYELCLGGACTTSSGAPPCPAGLLCDEAGARCIGATEATCAIRDVATSPASSGRYFAATIVQDGCAAGQVRVGTYRPHETGASLEEARLLLRGDFRRGAGYAGLDVEHTAGAEGARCSGASRAPNEARGAQDLVIASRPSDPHRNLRPQALIAWTGPRSGTCGDGTTRPVEAIGAWLEQTPAEVDAMHFVATSDSGATRALGRTSGISAPVVRVLDDPEPAYIVAYVDASGSAMTLHVVRALDDPAETSAIAPYPSFVDTRVPTRTRVTPPLVLLATRTIALRAQGARIETLDLAVGPAGEQGTSLGIVWQEGCGDAATAHFAVARLDAALELTIETAAQLTTEGPAFAPRIAWAHDAFALAYVTAEATSATVHVARALRPGAWTTPPVSLHTVSPDAASTLAPTLYVARRERSVDVALAVYLRDAATIVSTPLRCAPVSP